MRDIDTVTVAVYLLCEPPREEGDEVLVVPPGEAPDASLHEAHLHLLLRHLRDVLRVNRLALHTQNMLRQ